MTKCPCKECISLAICVSKKHIKCSDLLDFMYEERVTNGKVKLTPYSNFIEAKKFLSNIQQVEWPGVKDL